MIKENTWKGQIYPLIDLLQKNSNLFDIKLEGSYDKKKVVTKIITLYIVLENENLNLLFRGKCLIHIFLLSLLTFFLCNF